MLSIPPRVNCTSVNSLHCKQDDLVLNGAICQALLQVTIAHDPSIHFFLLILLNQTKISCIIHQNWFNMNYESLNWCTGGEVLLPTAHKDEHAICIYGIQNWVRGRGRGRGNSVHLHYVSPVRSAVERDTWSGTPLVVVSVMPWHWPVELGHSHILLNKGHAMLNHYNLHLHDGVWNLITI